MIFSRYFVLAFITMVFCTWLTLIAFAANAQGMNDDEEDPIELRSVNYVSADFGFGLALPDGYITFDYDDEDNNTWILNLVGEFDDPTALISAEPLPDDITDVAGFWQLMKERDPLMTNNITYEKIDSVDGCGAVQSRIERIESNAYILVITWVFVHDGYGFTLSGYPGQSEDYNSARDLALDLAEQFRWMTEEEIAEFLENPPQIVMPEGKEF